MTAVFVRLNSTYWSDLCAEITPIVRDNKKTSTSIKGDVRIIKPRTSQPSSAVTLQFPYLSLANMLILQSLAQAPGTVTLDHNMDMPKGVMQVAEFNRQVVKTLDGIAYNVSLTLSLVTSASKPLGLSAINPATYSFSNVIAWVG